MMMMDMMVLLADDDNVDDDDVDDTAILKTVEIISIITFPSAFNELQYGLSGKFEVSMHTFHEPYFFENFTFTIKSYLRVWWFWY